MQSQFKVYAQRLLEICASMLSLEVNARDGKVSSRTAQAKEDFELILIATSFMNVFLVVLLQGYGEEVGIDLWMAIAIQMGFIFSVWIAFYPAEGFGKLMGLFELSSIGYEGYRIPRETWIKIVIWVSIPHMIITPIDEWLHLGSSMLLTFMITYGMYKVGCYLGEKYNPNGGMSNVKIKME